MEAKLKNVNPMDNNYKIMKSQIDNYKNELIIEEHNY